MATGIKHRRWEKDNPLSGVERYLWKRLRKYPFDDDWRRPRKRTPLHLWYEEGWELINTLQERFFKCCSSHGNEWPFHIEGLSSTRRLYNVICQWESCTEWADSIVREDYARSTKDDVVYLEDAQFYCYPHYHEVRTGEKYVPPTLDEQRRSAALMKAMEAMLSIRPSESIEVLGIPVISTMMDRDYLVKLAEITESEYQKMCKMETQ